MAIFARAPEGKYVVAPEGLHAAVCCDVIDHGVVDTPFGQKSQVEVRWQLEDAIETPAGLIRPIVRQRFTNSLHEKAKLRLVLETWRGQKLSKAELKAFDLETLIGASCQIQVIHRVSDEGNTFANVNAVIPLGKGMPRVLVASDYVRQRDRATKQAITKNDESETLTDEEIPF